MDLLTPFIQDGPEGVAAQEQAPSTSGPLIDAPTPQLWLGFGAGAVIFLLLIMFMIRARVIAPARRRAAAQQAVFEPAGEDAEITFDELEPAVLQTDEILEDEDLFPPSQNSDASPATNGGNQEAVERSEKVKKSRAPFAGLFSRKDKKEEPDHNDVLDHNTTDGGYHDQLAEVSISEIPAHDEEEHRDEQPDHARPVVDALRKLDDDVEARRRQAELEERERLRHETRLRAEAEQSKRLEQEREELYQAARDDARREAEFERRKNEAALEQRLRSLASVERKLSEKADTLGADVNVVQERLTETMEERFAALSAELNQRLEHAAAQNIHTASGPEPTATEMADYVGQELSNLRRSMQDALQRLTKRIDDLSAERDPSRGLSAQLADLKQLVERKSTRPLKTNLTPLPDLVSSTLPQRSYALDAHLSNKRQASCIVNPPGGGAPVAINAHYPVEAFERYLLEGVSSSSDGPGANEYRRAVLSCIVDTAEKLIIPGETATSAMIYAPSDVIINDLHAHFPDLIQDSHRARVWIVSPTSLMATLDAMSVMAEASSAHKDQIENTSAGDDTVLAEIDRLRERVARTDDHAFDAPEILTSNDDAALAVTELDNGIADSSDFFDHEPNSEAMTEQTAEKASENYRSLSPEEEAFERLEREEALAEADTTPEPDTTIERPPFPLR
ncbi:MAG: DNA recombination protein RmuC [Pseudomonadota bacterium]